MALKKLAFFLSSMKRFSFTAASFAMAMSLSTLCMAQTVPCDPEYMDALESRAYLEAQREIAMNQNLIAKPDSVLEYTCFDRIMGTIARAPSDRGNFSESNRWGEITNHGATSLDAAFDTVVTSALISYINTNYNHNFLGGRSTENHTPQNVTGNAGTYSCNRMLAVWNAARCMNFFNQTHDEFQDFQYLSTNDPRRLPTVCPNNGITTEWINRAFNNEANRYVLQTENPMDNTAYTADPMVTHLNRINPYGTAPATTCAEGIPTGVVVFRQGFTPPYYYEKVCPNPGCYYVPSGAGSQASPSNTGECRN